MPGPNSAGERHAESAYRSAWPDCGAGEELSLGDIDTLPVVMNVVTAGEAFGLGRTKRYELAKTGWFPCTGEGCRHAGGVTDIFGSCSNASTWAKSTTTTRARAWPVG